MPHAEPHPFAGKTVKLRASAEHHGVPSFGGSDFLVEDWWDRLSRGLTAEESAEKGNPAAVNYVARSLSNMLPADGQTVYGKIKSTTNPFPFGHIVHNIELVPPPP